MQCWFKLASFLSHNSSPSLLVISPYFYWWEVPLWTDLICYGEVGSQRIQALILFVQRLTSLQQSSHPHWLSQWSPMNHLCKKLPLDLKYHLCSPLIHLNIEKVSCDPTLITKNHHFLMLCHEAWRSFVTQRWWRKIITFSFHSVSWRSVVTLGNVQMFSPEMHPGLTILGPPPIGQHRT